MMDLKKTRLKAHTQSSIIPLFHPSKADLRHSMRLAKRMAENRILILIGYRNSDTKNINDSIVRLYLSRATGALESVR